MRLRWFTQTPKIERKPVAGPWLPPMETIKIEDYESTAKTLYDEAVELDRAMVDLHTSSTSAPRWKRPVIRRDFSNAFQRLSSIAWRVDGMMRHAADQRWYAVAGALQPMAEQMMALYRKQQHILTYKFLDV